MIFLFFFKQKTAYEMRISDWSSDVCSSDLGLWKPERPGPTKIRPLAHVSLSDQVAATALMLCLSERAETAQGDPRGSFESPEVRRAVMSYGRSEEHTSELQSLMRISYAVFCLKKKT